MSLVVKLSTFCALIAVALAQKQEAVLYSEYNGEGNTTKFSWRYNSDLSIEDFANKTFSVCVTGVWLFYQEPNFNPKGNQKVESIFGENGYCTNIRTIPGAISSVKYAGAPNDYRTDSLTVYQHDYFQGHEDFFLKDTKSLTQFIGKYQSIIATGTSDWTVYDQPNFQGHSACLQVPDPYSFTFVPSFIANFRKSAAESFDFQFGFIESVRKGCTGKNNLTMSSF